MSTAYFCIVSQFSTYWIIRYMSWNCIHKEMISYWISLKNSTVISHDQWLCIGENSHWEGLLIWLPINNTDLFPHRIYFHFLIVKDIKEFPDCQWLVFKIDTRPSSERWNHLTFSMTKNWILDRHLSSIPLAPHASTLSNNISLANIQYKAYYSWRWSCQLHPQLFWLHTLTPYFL